MLGMNETAAILFPARWTEIDIKQMIKKKKHGEWIEPGNIRSDTQRKRMKDENRLRMTDGIKGEVSSS